METTERLKDHAAAVAERARARIAHDRRFFTGAAVIAALIAFAGFAPSYYLKPFVASPPLSSLAHLHGLVMTAWLANDRAAQVVVDPNGTPTAVVIGSTREGRVGQTIGRWFADAVRQDHGIEVDSGRFGRVAPQAADRRSGRSIVVEPLGDWGQGAVQLVELPASSEFQDNVAAFWVADRPAPAGSAWRFAYRLHWLSDEPSPPNLARIVATRMHALPLPHRIYYNGRVLRRIDAGVYRTWLPTTGRPTVVRQAAPGSSPVTALPARFDVAAPASAGHACPTRRSPTARPSRSPAPRSSTARSPRRAPSMCSCPASYRGRTAKNTLPWPAALVTPTRPPCHSTMRLVSARPSPVPSLWTERRRPTK